MNDQGKILVVVPARGGSKGIRLKNLSKVGNVSLIELVANVVSEVLLVSRAVVSTDHDMIKEEAIRTGLEVPFARPPELSGDEVSDVDVLTHALEEVETTDRITYDLIVMLQPTSPMRTPHHVSESINMVQMGDYDSVLTVSQTNSKEHPLKQLVMKGDTVEYYDEAGKDIIARQQLREVFHRNGAAYVMTRQCLLEQKTTIGARSGAIVVSEPMVNIDTPLDLEFANWLVERRRSRSP